jgi:hypothetical protein
MNSVVSLPRPPWLTSEMPARPRSSSGSERACAAFDLLAVDDFDRASESSTVIAVRVPVTTTVSRSVALRPWWPSGVGGVLRGGNGRQANAMA